MTPVGVFFVGRAEQSETLSTAPTWYEVRSVRFPWLFSASIFILYAKAFSDGRMCSRCRLLSTMVMTASSSERGRIITGMVSIPSVLQAASRRWPEISSYPPPFLGRAMAGDNTPASAMLFISSAISASFFTLNGWFLKGVSSESGSSSTLGLRVSARSCSVMNSSS